MYTRTITYKDFNDVERKETFHFNLNKSEITDMEGSYEGGLSTMLQKIIDAKDATKIIKVFKELLLKSYGEISDDGRRFIKSKEISEAFSQTNAYDMLYMELATDAKAATDFVNAIIPSDLKSVVEKEMAPKFEVIEK